MPVEIKQKFDFYKYKIREYDFFVTHNSSHSRCYQFPINNISIF